MNDKLLKIIITVIVFNLFIFNTFYYVLYIMQSEINGKY